VLDVIGCEDVCGDRLCKYMGCGMNNNVLLFPVD